MQLFFFVVRPAPLVKKSGESGILYVAEPLEACTTLTNELSEDLGIPFVLIRRGKCSFEAKVRNAQYAGFKAAIVFDNEDRGILISSKFFIFVFSAFSVTQQ